MSAPSTLHEITRRNVELIGQMQKAFDSHRTSGEWLADSIAAVVGSWTFLILQSVLLVIWMALNIVGWWKQWDPYPFVLLNLVLSFQAAYATPILLMSQNRQSRIDERRNHLDLQINLLAEQENTEQLRMLRLLCEHARIPLHIEGQKAFEESTQPEEIVRQIAENVESENSSA